MQSERREPGGREEVRTWTVSGAEAILLLRKGIGLVYILREAGPSFLRGGVVCLHSQDKLGEASFYVKRKRTMLGVD